MLSVSCSAEVAHTLFVDIVGFSRRSMDSQRAALSDLQWALTESDSYRATCADDRLVRLPTGDGFALVFFGDHLLPIRCALEIARALNNRPGMDVRMGIHSGPCDLVRDLNANENVYGGGINEAQRVMSCGDAGHILMSYGAADLWVQRGGWEEWLHPLGEYRLKHGKTAILYAIHSSGIGNSRKPRQSILWRLRNWYLRTPLAFFIGYTLFCLAIYRTAYTRGQMDPRVGARHEAIQTYARPTHILQ
jgi:class 3 adenylate cyclase